MITLFVHANLNRCPKFKEELCDIFLSADNNNNLYLLIPYFSLEYELNIVKCIKLNDNNNFKIENKNIEEFKEFFDNRSNTFKENKVSVYRFYASDIYRNYVFDNFTQYIQYKLKFIKQNFMEFSKEERTRIVNILSNNFEL